MALLFWSTKEHSLTSDEVVAIEKSILEAQPLKFDDWKRPANTACRLTDGEIQRAINDGNVAYDGLDFDSSLTHFRGLLQEGVDWIPFLRARCALTECNFATDEPSAAPIFSIVLETHTQCPADSASFLGMALLKLRDKLFAQALQWLHFASLATQSPKSVFQYVSHFIEFSIREYDHNIEKVLPHLLNQSRLDSLLSEHVDIKMSVIGPLLDEIRADRINLLRIRENEDFQALIAAASEVFFKQKWYLFLDEEVQVQSAPLAQLDEKTFSRITDLLDMPSLGALMSTCKLLANRCRGDKVMLGQLKLAKIALPQTEVPCFYESLMLYRAAYQILWALDAIDPWKPETMEEAENLAIRYSSSDGLTQPLIRSPLAKADFLVAFLFGTFICTSLDAEWIEEACDKDSNFLAVILRFAFRPVHRNALQTQTVAIIMLIGVSSIRGKSAKSIRAVLRSLGVMELCQLTGDLQIQGLQAHLYSLLASEDIIDYEHSLIGLNEEIINAKPLSEDCSPVQLPPSVSEFLSSFPAESSESGETNNDTKTKKRPTTDQVTSGIWHLVVHQIGDVYNQRAPLRGMVHLKPVENAEEEGWLAGDGYLSGTGDVAMTFDPTNRSQLLLKKGHLDDADPIEVGRMKPSLANNLLVCNFYPVILLSTIGGYFGTVDERTGNFLALGSWIAWRDTRHVSNDGKDENGEKEKWIADLIEDIKSQPEAEDMVKRYMREMNHMDEAAASEFRDTINQFYSWSQTLASNAYKMSHWAVYSVSELKVYEDELNTINEEILSGPIDDITPHFMRGPTETIPQHVERCRILFGTIKMLNLLRTQILKGFMHDLKSTLDQISAFIDIQAPTEDETIEILGLVTTWSSRFSNCPLLIPGDPQLTVPTLGRYLFFKYDEVQASLREFHDQQSVGNGPSSSMESLVKQATKRKGDSPSSSWSTTLLIAGSITAVSAILAFGAFKLGSWLGNKK